MLVPLPVREIMRTPVKTISPDAPVVEAAQRLRDEDIGSLVVEDDGGCVGIITESDIVAVTAAEGDTGALSVGDVMAETLVTIAPDADIETAVEQLRTNNIKKLPVVEDGALVGIVTTTDLSDYIPHLSRAGVTSGDNQSQEKRFTRPDTLYENEDWTFESFGTADGIDVGDHVQFSKTISQADVEAFAEASGDTNRLHLDAEFAERTRFGRRIAHGTLVSGIVSAALARLPGLTIYLSQELSYQGPVDIGEEVTARCEVVERIRDNRFRLSTAVDDADGNCVIEGDAVVISDPIPEAA
jgi:CBS domain-containing protein/acyl dehydratase